MLILSHSEIMALNVEPVQCYEWVNEMIKNKNETILPAKLSLKPRENIFYNVMPSLLPQFNIGGVKVVTRYPDRIPSLDSQILLYDYESGHLKALLDGNFITTIRTGAVAAHSIKLFAKSDFEVIGLIGLGNQARATLKVLLSLFPEKQFVLKLFKYKDQHILFMEYIKSLGITDKISFVICDSYEETVRGSDVIISSVTYFEKDICSDDCFDEGCLVVPIHTRGFMNCDLFFDKVFADDTDHVKGFKYFDQFKKFAEVTDVLNGVSPGRENDSERILAYNIGLSIHDIYFSYKIYELAKLNGNGKEFQLDAPTEKFWI